MATPPFAGGSLPAGIPQAGQGGVTQLIQQLLQAKGQPPSFGTPVQGGGIGTPSRTGVAPQAPTTPQYGGQGLGIPHLPGGPAPSVVTSGATAGGPFAGVQPQQTQSGTGPFYDKGSRTAANVQNAFAGLGNGVVAFKQKQFQKRQQEAKAAALSQLAQQDPQFQGAMQKVSQVSGEAGSDAQEAMQKAQEKWVKIFEKAQKDPNSAEYYGIQQAYQEAMGQAAAKQQQELVMAQIQEANQKAQQAQAAAALDQRKAQLEGQVTQAKQLESDTEIKKAQIQGMSAENRVKMQTQAHLEGINKQTQAMLAAASMRTEAIKAGLGVRTGDKRLDALGKEYENLNNQIKELDTNGKNLSQYLKDHPIKDWMGTKDTKDVRTQLQGISQQQDILRKQLALVDQKRQALIQIGVAPVDFGNTGAPSEPITVSPEDMK